MDISSLLLGLLIGGVSAFGTGFLKRAGEDLYASIKRKFSPQGVTVAPPQLVVHFHDDRSDPQLSAIPESDLKLVPIERLTQVSFADIEMAIDKAPPLQREQVAKNYVGLKVDWDAYLRSANVLSDGQVRLRLSMDERYVGRSIVCLVNKEDYQILSVLPQGAPIRVLGEISSASSYDVELSNVKLQIAPL